MKKGMKMPGFSAEASIYKSNGHYMMCRVPGEITKALVGTATSGAYYDELLATYQTQFLIDWYLGDKDKDKDKGGGGHSPDPRYAICRTNCIAQKCDKASAGAIARCISDCEKSCRTQYP